MKILHLFFLTLLRWIRVNCFHHCVVGPVKRWMSSKKTKTWPVSTPPNTPGGESKSLFFCCVCLSFFCLFNSVFIAGGAVSLSLSLITFCSGLRGNFSLQLFSLGKNPEILTQCFHCVDFLIWAQEKKKKKEEVCRPLISSIVTCALSFYEM